MIRSAILLAPFGVAASFGLVGCAAIKPAERPVTLRLSPAPIMASVERQVAARIGVAPVAARGLSGGLRYAYIDATAPAEIRLAASLFWEESPTHVLERALVAALRIRFTSVAGPEIGSPVDRRVVARLDRFEEGAAGGAAKAVVAFDVTITGDVPQSGRYCAAVPIDSPVPSIRAAAFDTAVGQTVTAFSADAAAGRLMVSTC